MMRFKLGKVNNAENTIHTLLDCLTCVGSVDGDLVMYKLRTNLFQRVGLARNGLLKRLNTPRYSQSSLLLYETTL
jgi:hypothetical protein